MTGRCDNGYGVYGISNAVGVLGSAYTGVAGLSATDNGTGASGVCDVGSNAWGLYGESVTGYGVFCSGPTAIYGVSTALSGQAIYGNGTGTNTEGVLGTAAGIHASAVYGIASATSGDPAGVDGPCDYGDAIYGSSTYGTAVKAIGTFVATGTKSAEVKLNNGTPIRLFTEEATEVYFADYGSATLENGRAHIDLDPVFLQTVTVDGTHPMKVFVQLEGDCKGVFVTNKSATGFDVVELQGGTSSVPFSYRVVCKRKYYEDERLATQEQEASINKRVLETVWPEVLAKRQAKLDELKAMEKQADECRLKAEKIQATAKPPERAPEKKKPLPTAK